MSERTAGAAGRAGRRRAVPDYPSVEIHEEALREGMQIESESIPSEAKVVLLNALSETGLKDIDVGSFVSSRWTPQMADVEAVVANFTPVPGVNYFALALNERGRERRRRYVPPLREDNRSSRTRAHLCDVFVRRNANRSQADEIAGWAGIVDRAEAEGAREAEIGLNAAWGSNWLGDFSLNDRMELLRQQWELWDGKGIRVVSIFLGDPMGWNVPDQVEEQLRAITEEWPAIRRVHLHLHNTRGSALTSAYAALRVLDSRHVLVLDTCIGGMGGCPYCGNGRATGMIPTEDLVDMLEEMGIPTGIDVDRLIECSLLAEQIVGHQLYGNVARSGRRPRGAALYPMDLPLIETLEEAQHFRIGPSVYEGGRRPWRSAITSPARDEVERRQGLR